jgi:hypothetical protein
MKLSALGKFTVVPLARNSLRMRLIKISALGEDAQ